jgi:hypothetical protein
MTLTIKGTYTCTGSCATAVDFHATGTATGNGVSFNFAADAHIVSYNAGTGCGDQESTWKLTSTTSPADTLSYKTTSDNTCAATSMNGLDPTCAGKNASSDYLDKSALAVTGGTGQYNGANGTGTGTVTENTGDQTVCGTVTLNVTTPAPTTTTKTLTFPVHGTYTCSTGVCVAATSYTASGSADTGPTGVYTFTATINQTGAADGQGCIPQQEQWTLTHGSDQLTTSSTSDTACPSSDPTVYNDTGVLKVTGGRGQFSGAAGDGTLKVAENVLTQTIDGTLTLTVNTTTTSAAPAANPKPTWRLTVTPRHASKRRRVRFKFTLIQTRGTITRRYAGATIRFARRSARTGAKGTATITTRLRGNHSVYVARAVVAGRQVAVTRVRLRARHPKPQRG